MPPPQASQFHHQIVKRAVMRGLDRGPRDRERVAVLFSMLFARGVLTEPQVSRGFEALAGSIGELTLDCPDAPPDGWW